MPSFALITEGITDQAILEALLEGFYQKEDIEVVILQPARDATDENRQGDFGGFEKVLEYCGLDYFAESLTYNEYVVIQIDTDCCSHPNIKISTNRDGRALSAEELIEEMKDLLISRIGREIYDELQHRILFAIAVHSSECWLLPLHGTTPAQRSRENSCEAQLNHALNIQKIGYSKDYRTYQKLSKPYEKQKMIHEAAQHSKSLEIFLNSLPINNE